MARMDVPEMKPPWTHCVEKDTTLQFFHKAAAAAAAATGSRMASLSYLQLPPYPPACHIARMDVPEGGSRHTKGLHRKARTGGVRACEWVNGRAPGACMEGGGGGEGWQGKDGCTRGRVTPNKGPAQGSAGGVGVQCVSESCTMTPSF
jgi:hypothetical protein